MDRKYLFFDIDGTLAWGMYGSQVVPESTKRALKLLEQNGHFVCIATGRSEALARDYMHELGFHNMVSDGGYGITINDELVEQRPLDKDLCVALIDECEAKGFVWALMSDNSYYRYAPDERFMEVTHDTYQGTKVVPGLDPRACEQIYKVNVACFDGEESQLDMLNKIPWARYQKEYIFVEPADKAYGIKQMVAHEGGDICDVFVFGDGKNDLSMFLPEWTCVAMGNAIDELKAKATYVTTDCDKDGIWNACVHFGLIDEQSA